MQIDRMKIQEGAGYALLAGGSAVTLACHLRGKPLISTVAAAAVGAGGFALANNARTERDASGIDSIAKDRINEGVNLLLPPGSENRERAGVAMVGGGALLMGAAWLVLNPNRVTGFAKYAAERLTTAPTDYPSAIKNDRRMVMLAGATASAIGIGLGSDKGIVDGTIEEIEKQRNPIGVGE